MPYSILSLSGGGQMILLCADPAEVKWVNYGNKLCIGVGAKHIDHYKLALMANDKVILFGSCGRLDSNLRDYGKLIIPIGWFNQDMQLIVVAGDHGYGITTNHSVKYKWERQLLFNQNIDCVDQESYHVAKLCKELNVPFLSVRYMIDRCDRKAMPTGINHFWRMWQHKRMQLKFNEWLRENV